MRIYCDGSVKNGVGAIGIVVVDHNIILHRDGYIVPGDKSTDMELEALKASLRLTIEYPADEIYTDYKYTDKDPEWYESWPSTFTGIKKWIPRERNQIAHGMASLAVESFNWRKEIEAGEKLIVIDTLTPMNWNVRKKIGGAYNTVHIHKKKFHCDCENFNFLSKCKFSCRHIWAVKIRLNIINAQGEGMF